MNAWFTFLITLGLSGLCVSTISAVVNPESMNAWRLLFIVCHSFNVALGLRGLITGAL